MSERKKEGLQLVFLAVGLCVLSMYLRYKFGLPVIPMPNFLLS